MTGIGTGAEPSWRDPGGGRRSLISAWDEIWERRPPEPGHSSVLGTLIALDGFDSGDGILSEQNWAQGVHETARRLGLSPDDSVYEVGCGAGAFLYPLHNEGYRVGGLDRSAALIGRARQAIPGGRFTCCDAADLDDEPWDAVVSFSAFEYFPSHEYARRVITVMARKARMAVAVMDLPDLAVREAAEERRAELAGGPEAYAERYAGLEHRYYDRSWVTGVLEDCGLEGVRARDQWFGGYGNAAFRFSAWGFRPGARDGEAGA